MLGPPSLRCKFGLSEIEFEAEIEFVPPSYTGIGCDLVGLSKLGLVNAWPGFTQSLRPLLVDLPALGIFSLVALVFESLNRLQRSDRNTRPIFRRSELPESQNPFTLPLRKGMRVNYITPHKSDRE